MRAEMGRGDSIGIITGTRKESKVSMRNETRCPLVH